MGTTIVRRPFEPRPRRRRRRVVPGLALAGMALVLAGCGGSGSSEQSATPADGDWDLVALGDSTVDDQGVAVEERYTEVYAAMLGEELGVKVEVRSHTDPDTVADWNDAVATDQALRADLKEAELVTLFLGFHDIGNATLGGECDFGWPEPTEECLSAVVASLSANYERLLGAIRELVGEQTPIVIGYDGGLPPPLVEWWSSKPNWRELERILTDGWRPDLYAAAEAHGATVIPFFEQKVDPSFLQSDGAHFNAKGHRFLAELHAANDGLGG